LHRHALGRPCSPVTPPWRCARRPRANASLWASRVLWCEACEPYAVPCAQLMSTLLQQSQGRARARCGHDSRNSLMRALCGRLRVSLLWPRMT
jgi:hypothetical protein